ncbi:FAS1 domain-containing protein precursor [Rhizodiscina lignyota]|uniref:FAS1 domain-containing protein n=1 Tax=Rhizodiscina lignyota TaxID=1504668 RepID=A0A9P4IEC6_9PEZI|nr:FAS1 domain-containing protein precursor [Rhizodiscina lignyota]
MDPPNVVLPPSSGADDGRSAPDASSDLTISDVIASERRINIFSGFTRDIGTVSKRLEDGGQNSTIVAPDNSHIMKLPRKPWEDPRDYQELGADAYSGNDGEDRAHRNLRRFVEAHIIPESPWAEGKKVQTLVGSTVWWEQKDGKRFIQPGNVEVDNVANTVSNGEVWILKGVLNYQ